MRLASRILLLNLTIDRPLDLAFVTFGCLI
uniref:Uncharacterized protein n=1 Tax=Rhizophora mucronata TaxID=61149 RepID=A0A2P2PWN3_RHIMU